MIIKSGISRLLGIIALILFVYGAFAQAPAHHISEFTDELLAKEKLKDLKKDYGKRFKKNHKKALKKAKKENWVIHKKFDDGRVISLQGIDNRGKPIYYSTFARKAANTTSTDDVWTGGALNLTLDGSSSVVKDKLGIWDGGPVRDSHQELTDRVNQEDKAGSSYDDHATHVAGILIGEGKNVNAHGMAFKANLKAWEWNNDLSEMTQAASNGLLLSNHSYGLGNIGWVYNSERISAIKWEWWGDTGIDDFEDYRFGYYDSFAQSVDEITYNAPYYLPVIAAGNSRGLTGPGEGSHYYLTNTNSTSDIKRKSQKGHDLLSSIALSKNALTIGAIYSLPNGFNHPSEVEVADFSSWGPADDGRVKPDLMGDGVKVFSSIATSDQSYDSYSGTSMATPNITGSLLLLQEYFASLYNGQFIRAATLKGLAIHSADDVGNPGPDYTFGWGVLNTARVAQTISNAEKTHYLSENTLKDSYADTLIIIASGSGALKATLSWSDPSVAPLTVDPDVVNNRTPTLVNDLDMVIYDGLNEYMPWTLDPNDPEKTAIVGNNTVDNVEQVLIKEPVPGKEYSIIIRHKGSLQDGTQDYSLILSGVGGDAYCDSRAGEDQGTMIKQVRFGSFLYEAENVCTSYTDHANEFSELLVRQDSAYNLHVSLGSCDETVRSKIVKVFIDWDHDYDFNNSGELIATSGIISGNGTFESSIDLPDSIVSNTFTRLRIVCVETNSADEVDACGSYTRGETFDLSLKFIEPSFDIRTVALISPNEDLCSNVVYNPEVEIENIGSNPVENIPVYLIVSGNGEAFRFQDTLRNTLYPGSTGTVSFRENLNIVPEIDYRFTIIVGLENDQFHSNDTLIISWRSPGIVLPPNVEAYICDDSNISLLSDENEGITYWYADQHQQASIGFGKFVLINDLPPDSTFYAAINDLNVSLGPVNKNEFGGGSYGAGFVPEPLISTHVPLIIDSARLYIGNSGTLTFSVLTSSGIVVSSSVVKVEATRDPSVFGDSEDDPADEGKMYSIGLVIPEPGDYRIHMEYGDDATVFRSNEGVSGFPFDVKSVVSLSGSLYQGDTLTSAYYYLYDMKIKSTGCVSERVPVKAIKGPSVTPLIFTADPTQVCNEIVLLEVVDHKNHSYQWRKDGEEIHSTSYPYFEATISGSYDVIISNDQCVYSPSNTIDVDITSIGKPVIDFEGETLVSSSTSGNQWYLDGRKIENANDVSFEPTIAGYYTVEVTKNFCSIVSDSLFVYVEPPVSEGIWLYPNPATDVLTIRIRESLTNQNYQFTIYDVSGRKIHTAPFTYLFEDISEAVVDISFLPKGSYYLRVSKESKNWFGKFMKH